MMLVAPAEEPRHAVHRGGCSVTPIQERVVDVAWRAPRGRQRAWYREEGADEPQARWLVVGKRMGGWVLESEAGGLPGKRSDDVQQGDVPRVKRQQKRHSRYVKRSRPPSAASRELESHQAGADEWGSPIG
jgi:hypothetical protein